MLFRSESGMKHYDYVLVGSGLYAGVFAWYAKKNGKTCLVVEKRDHIGGNIYCEDVEGIHVHKYGAHIFHTSDEKVWAYVNQFAHFNHYINSPVAVYQDEIYNMPFNMNTFSRMWKVKTPAEAKAKIQSQIRELNLPPEPRNLEEQALSLVGKDVYEKLVKGYTEKQWGRDCRDLPAFIIKRLPLRFVYDNNYFNDPHQGIPEEGYTKMVEAMLEGTEVWLHTDYFKLIEKNPDLAEKTVFTGMIDAYYQYRLGVLEYRSLRFEEERLACENYQGNAVVNYTEREVPYTRIIEHKHFNFGKQPVTVITREYPRTWTRGEEPYYPINDERNNRLFARYRELAEQEKNVIFGGRLGMYQYYDMDKVIAAALKAAEKEFGEEEKGAAEEK